MRQLACEWEMRCREIANIIESVDNRAMATDGDVPTTMEVMHQDEMTRIYQLALGKRKSTTRGRNCKSR